MNNEDDLQQPTIDGHHLYNNNNNNNHVMNINGGGNNIELRSKAIERTFGVNDNDNTNNYRRSLIDEFSFNNNNNTQNDNTLIRDLINNSFSTSSTTGSAATDTITSDIGAPIGFDSATITKSNKRNNNNNKKYSSRIKKTLTYDVIKDNCDDNNENAQQDGDVDDNDDDDDYGLINLNDANTDLTDKQQHNSNSSRSTKVSVNTNLLLGDTDALISKLNEKKQEKKRASAAAAATTSPIPPSQSSMHTTTEQINEVEALSTRVVINGSQIFNDKRDDNEIAQRDDDTSESGIINRSSRGLAFSVDLNENLTNKELIKINYLKQKQQLLHLNNSNINNNKLINEILSKPPVQTKTIDLFKRPRSRTESANASLSNQMTQSFTSNANSSDNENNSERFSLQTPKSQLTEPSLGTKIQQKAKLNANLVRRSSVSSEKDSKTTTTTTTAPMQSNRTLYLRQQSAKAKRDSFNLGQPSSSSSSVKPSSILKSARKDQPAVSKTPPQTPSTASNRHSLINKPTRQINSSRSSSPSVANSMCSQSVLNQSNLSNTAAKDSFQRRKNYDPIKAVEDEKIRRKLKQTLQPQTSVVYHNDAGDDDETQSVDLTKPIEKLKSNINNNKQVIIKLILFKFFLSFISIPFFSLCLFI